MTRFSQGPTLNKKEWARENPLATPKELSIYLLNLLDVLISRKSFKLNKKQVVDYSIYLIINIIRE